MTDKIDNIIAELTSESAFKTALEFGKLKLDEYWVKMINEILYYYAAGLISGSESCMV